MLPLHLILKQWKMAEGNRLLSACAYSLWRQGNMRLTKRKCLTGSMLSIKRAKTR